VSYGPCIFWNVWILRSLEGLKEGATEWAGFQEELYDLIIVNEPSLSLDGSPNFPGLRSTSALLAYAMGILRRHRWIIPIRWNLIVSKNCVLQLFELSVSELKLIAR